MNIILKQKLDEACFKAIRLGFRIGDKRGLVFRDGFYQSENDYCTPLEAVLMGEEELSGNFENDACKVLNITGLVDVLEYKYRLEHIFIKNTE